MECNTEMSERWVESKICRLTDMWLVRFYLPRLLHVLLSFQPPYHPSYSRIQLAQSTQAQERSIRITTGILYVTRKGRGLYKSMNEEKP